MKNCDKCNKKISYNSNFDSYYCRYCNEWKECICSDIGCLLCKYRPPTPNKIKKVNVNTEATEGTFINEKQSQMQTLPKHH